MIPEYLTLLHFSVNHQAYFKECSASVDWYGKPPPEDDPFLLYIIIDEIPPTEKGREYLVFPNKRRKGNALLFESKWYDQGLPGVCVDTGG